MARGEVKRQSPPTPTAMAGMDFQCATLEHVTAVYTTMTDGAALVADQTDTTVYKYVCFADLVSGTSTEEVAVVTVTRTHYANDLDIQHLDGVNVTQTHKANATVPLATVTSTSLAVSSIKPFTPPTKDRYAPAAPTSSRSSGAEANSTNLRRSAMIFLANVAVWAGLLV